MILMLTCKRYTQIFCINLVHTCFELIAGIAAKTNLRSKSAIPLDVDLWSISNIRENEETFKVKFKLDMKWKDSRLKFINLKEDVYTNIVPPEEADKIWLPPPVMFLNTDNLDKATVSNNFGNHEIL